jgi:hypothetical protein
VLACLTELRAVYRRFAVKSTDPRHPLTDCEPVSGDLCVPDAGPPSVVRGLVGIGLAVGVALAPWALLTLIALAAWRLFG